MKKLGIVFIIIGIFMVGWFGYQYWHGMQSMTKINENVVKTVNDGGSAISSSSNVMDDTEDKTQKDDSENQKGEPTNQKDESPNQIPNESLKAMSYTDGEGVATLVMPSIGIAYDVFWGTGSDVLAKGVGMYDSDVTTTPDQMGHTVLSGHRDSVFRPVGDLQEGDSIYVRYENEDYQYQIDKIWITDEDDQGVIVDKADPTLTLTTCYPFHFIGDASERFIVQAEYIKEGDLLDL